MVNTSLLGFRLETYMLHVVATVSLSKSTRTCNAAKLAQETEPCSIIHLIASSCFALVVLKASLYIQFFGNTEIEQKLLTL